MFFIRAAFWLAVVSLFVPKEFAGGEIELPQAVAETRIDAEGAVGDWCADRQEICEAGEEAARLGAFLADMAVDRIEAAIEDQEDSAR